jgi:cytochrome c553
LKTAFLEVETFFKGRSTADAVGWAGEALKAVDAAAGASLVGKWDEARTAAGTIQGLCATCHAQHRERQDDGTFRVRGMTGG